MTAALLALPPETRKAVLDTCAVFEGGQWKRRFQGQVTSWLGEDGTVVLPGRVVAEMARVAAAKFLQGDEQAHRAQQRAALALTDPGQMLGVARARRAVLTRTDVAELCSDSGDPDLMLAAPGSSRCVPGDADFEIAHVVRVLLAAAHEAVLVTRDRDLQEAAGRLGVALLHGLAPETRLAERVAGTAPALPEPAAGRGVHVLGLEATTTLLRGRLPVLGGPGDVAVVLSSTLVRAAQRATHELRRGEDGKPDAAELAEVQQRLRLLLTTGDPGRGQRRVHVHATTWPIYRRAAERVSSPRFAVAGEGARVLDMHSLLVLAAVEVLGDAGHEVRLASSGRSAQNDHLLAAALAWREAGALKQLAGAAHHRFGDRHLTDVPLPGDGTDLAALLDKYRRR